MTHEQDARSAQTAETRGDNRQPLPPKEPRMSADHPFGDIEPVTHDPRGEISAEITSAVETAKRDLWAAVADEVADLRDEIRALQRLIDSRTGHLA